MAYVKKGVVVIAPGGGAYELVKDLHEMATGWRTSEYWRPRNGEPPIEEIDGPWLLRAIQKLPHLSWGEPGNN